MQVTINIPDELAAEAERQGVSTESYVETLVLESKRSTIEQPSPPKKMTMGEMLEKMSAFSHKIPSYPGQTFNREFIYQDHD